MKRILATVSAATLVLGAATPGFAMPARAAGADLAGPVLVQGLGASVENGTEFDRRGRGGRSGGRSKPRIPGGSGCDSAHDIAEHPECR